ncbi:MAG: Nif3-like dinuclear metal center hexameric protein [Chlorobi bacterium]|nr:Nif3-like dinuclear metal center hexameric protein [Chlorobiota bacterium]
MKIKEITNRLEEYAPLTLQEPYDNAGLLTGSPDGETSKVLITLDVTHEVMDEAIGKGCNLIIAHHPLIFKALKRLTGDDETQQLIIKAIKNDIALYAIHTNIDNVIDGVNGMLAQKLGLKNIRILTTKEGGLKKLVTFCPDNYADKVRGAIFQAGGGHIGNYDSCSYNLKGEGTFRGLEGANPFVGKKGEIHFEKETRIETIVPDYKINAVIRAMLEAHPYEEVAYDVYPLDNENNRTGAGIIGEPEDNTGEKEFLERVKRILKADVIRHSPLRGKKVSKVAICGGSGSFLIQQAYRAGADIFITGDVKYHDFFGYAGRMVIADAGHYETEQFTKELIYSVLKENFPNFALLISEVNTNPVRIL